MKNKITLLIIASVLSLMALSAIQGYLINNTYKLKKSTYLDQVTGWYSTVEDHSMIMDSIENIWYKGLKKLMIKHHYKQLARDSIIPQLRRLTTPLDDSYVEAYSRSSSDTIRNYGLKFQKRLVALIILDSLGNDTLLGINAESGVLLLGEAFGNGGTHRLGRSTSQSSVNLDAGLAPGEIPEVIHYTLVTDNLIGIEGWHVRVLREMGTLLLTSILLFIFVLGILFYSIRTLIGQKKIAEIKTDFVNNITHEFKTPLATLSIATKLLAREEHSSQTEDIVAVIERQNTRLQRLTDQVVNHALSYREIELNKAPVNAEEYLTTLLDDFLLSLGEQEVTLVREITVEVQEVSLDKFYLTSALLNLLDNAVKYNDGPVHIVVKAQSLQGLELSIRDNGVGIPAAHLPHLREKFYRIGNQEEHNVKGLGLGLYFVDQVVRAHGGSLHIESTEGRGSCFTIRLPLR
ncbi:MAG: sensor histidine kinase [Lewinella sp.]